MIPSKGSIKTYAEDTLLSDQLHQLILNGANSVALPVGADVAQVTDVAGVIGGSTVGLAEGVD